eukprot:COSAG01_NODE_39_length_33243_cov_28.298558_10_plen_214_part_00
MGRFQDGNGVLAVRRRRPRGCARRLLRSSRRTRHRPARRGRTSGGSTRPPPRVDRNKSWLRFPYVSIFWRSHYLPPSHWQALGQSTGGQQPGRAHHILEAAGSLAPEALQKLGKLLALAVGRNGRSGEGRFSQLVVGGGFVSWAGATVCSPVPGVELAEHGPQPLRCGRVAQWHQREDQLGDSQLRHPPALAQLLWVRPSSVRTPRTCGRISQ